MNNTSQSENGGHYRYRKMKVKFTVVLLKEIIWDAEREKPTMKPPLQCNFLSASRTTKSRIGSAGLVPFTDLL